MLNIEKFDLHCYYTLAALICLCILLVFGLVELYKRRRARNKAKLLSFCGYSADPPETWRCKFPDATGKQQSPINFRMRYAVMMPSECYKPLTFNQQYFNIPRTMTVVNDGYGATNPFTLSLLLRRCSWSRTMLVGTCFEHEYPTVAGGPLKGRYRFNLAQFKWGPTDDEGSEHVVDSKRYGMELQLMHIKDGGTYDNIESAVRSKSVLFVSYLFQVTPTDNPYMTPLVDALDEIRRPSTSHMLEPFPLCWLFHPFKSKYFYYKGSLTCPPCTEGVDWIVQPEPLSISSCQLRRFRSLSAIDGAMRRNTRPVQKLNSRTVYFYD